MEFQGKMGTSQAVQKFNVLQLLRTGGSASDANEAVQKFRDVDTQNKTKTATIIKKLEVAQGFGQRMMAKSVLVGQNKAVEEVGSFIKQIAQGTDDPNKQLRWVLRCL